MYSGRHRWLPLQYHRHHRRRRHRRHRIDKKTQTKKESPRRGAEVVPAAAVDVVAVADVAVVFDDAVSQRKHNFVDSLRGKEKKAIRRRS